MDEEGFPFWWQSLGNRLGVGKEVDQLEKDFDPGFRGKLDNAIETYKTGKNAFRSKLRSGNTFKPGPGQSPHRPNLVQIGTPIRPHRSINTGSHGQSPQSNLHRSINTGSHGMGKRAGTDGEEVPVMPAGKVAKMHPDYFTIKLPHIFRVSAFTDSDLAYATGRPLMIIRLNSIYDPMKAVNATVAGVGDDPLKNSNVQPQGRDIWASHFKYYRVLQADVLLTFMHNYKVDPASIYMHHFRAGYELTDEDGAIADNAEMFMMTPRAHSVHMKPVPFSPVYNGVTPGTVTYVSTSQHVSQVQYTYRPESWNYHVEEKGSEERWTPIGANPSIDHDMQLRFMHLNSGTPPTDGDLGVTVQITYKVQFREATDSFFKTRSTATAGYPDADGEADD